MQSVSRVSFVSLYGGGYPMRRTMGRGHNGPAVTGVTGYAVFVSAGTHSSSQYRKTRHTRHKIKVKEADQ